MYRALILTPETTEAEVLRSSLACGGIACAVTQETSRLPQLLATHPVDALLVDIDGPQNSTQIEPVLEQLRRIKATRNIPIIAIVSEKVLPLLQSEQVIEVIDDFIMKPWRQAEMVVRVSRAVTRWNGAQKEILRHGELTIDLAKCEVSLNGVVLELTFKEYELLKFLAMNEGKTFTREALLNKVWGYNYYGGDRTVDVHIRRLRSKLGDYSSTYIQTIRNIGYRFSDKFELKEKGTTPRPQAARCNTDLTPL